MFVRYAALVFLAASSVRAAEIRGKITNVSGGEPLARVQVTVLEASGQASTSSDGSFAIKGLAPGKYTLRVNAVGYRLVTAQFSLASASEVKEFEINLAPDNFRRTDKVEIHGDVFQGDDPSTVNEINLTNSEMREASTVLADDPFRALQSLPGVSASGNNELYAEFSVEGAPFQNVAVYLDDVLIPGPFHNVPNTQNGASLSLLTSETVEDMKLLPAAYPEKFGDDVGAALDIRTRDGSRTAPLFRAAAGLADSEFLGEGQLGNAGKGSWLGSARKSYIGWLVRDRVGPDFSDVSFYDGDLKLSYDVAPGQNINLYGLAGHTNVEVTQPPDPSDLKHAAEDFYFARLGWRWSISPELQLDSRAAYIREPLAEQFAAGNESHNSYQEWTGGSSLVWGWTKDNLLEGGWTLRRLSDAYPSGSLQPNGSLIFFTANPAALKEDAYVQQSSSLFKNQLHLLGGIRYDSLNGFPPHPFSPQGSAAVQIAPDVELQLGYGRYTQYQFPPFDFVSPCPDRQETWQAANHYVATLDWRAAEDSRIRLQAFDRRTSNLLHIDPISCPGSALQPGITFTYEHHYSRGAQLIFQRRSANRLSGWIGYTLVFARRSDILTDPLHHATLESPYFSNFEDQRHSLNAFATYRLKPTINLSGKFLYGSGFPTSSGFIFNPGGTFQISPVTRSGPYVRLDMRADKSWAWARRKLTLYCEVLNLTNHANRIVTAEVNLSNNQLLTATAVALPITPTAGLAFEF